ncbi:MAG: Holliday junction branch migration protein RuvA [Lachnospiraceae bacterium]|nr:Holliday junction branch migration protein RuvA [Lachnospiraceae bacterium]MDD3614963.1 Holliday junction branch migration protein RuvA [Lachnospiraceae bacterium]
MISFVKGIVEEMGENFLVLDHQGLGFLIFMPGSSLDRLQIGEEYKIYTYMNVREDAMELFGFLSKDDLEFFRLLITVNGIGPKGAIGILSGLDADTLRFAILSDDAATIAKAPGIGKKTASKVILELKDKIHLEDAFEKKLEHQSETSVGQMKEASKEAIEALSALGYSNADAMQAVRKVENIDNMSVEQILKEALKHLAWL